MNQLKALQIQHFRNINHINIELGPGFNVFYGENGAGKTSLLEAIYYLSHGKSFRTHITDRVIQSGQDRMSIFAKLHGTNQQLIPIGFERLANGNKRLRLNGETATSLAEITRKLPVQLIRTDSYRYFHDGPKTRRQFLNWGLFHVEHRFLSCWRQFHHVLQQRNACLKARTSNKEIQAWDPEFARLATEIDKICRNYIESLQPALNHILARVLTDIDAPLTLRYQRGWPEDADLETLLRSKIHKDRQFGYSQYGPQRADLQLFCNNTPADDYLSQGQQKLAAYALYLAQGLVMAQQTDSAPIYLVDDLPSELDPKKRSIITGVLAEIDAQVLITGITQADLADIIEISSFPAEQMFHVEHGSIIHSIKTVDA